MEPLVERARRDGTPLIDAKSATFVWEGDDPPELVGDFNQFGREGRIALEQVAPSVWAHTMTLPPDAYIEYLYIRGDECFRDPHNRPAVTRLSPSQNSRLAMPEFVPTSLTHVRRTVPRGTVTRHRIDRGYFIDPGRTVRLYRPPVSGPCPLLVVLDGQDYLRWGRLPQIVDNLIDEERIQPFAMALVDHGRKLRGLEYSCNEGTLAYLLHRVLPLAREHLDLLDLAEEPGCHGLLGFSMSGQMALYASLRLPEVFGHVLSQSGAFGHGMEERSTMPDELIRYAPRQPVRIWLDVGRYEYFTPIVRHTYQLLKERDYDVTLWEFNGGHNWTCCKNAVWRGLELLFPPRS